MNNERRERRKGPDFWVMLTRTLAIGGWLLFIFALVISHYAAPEVEYGIVRYHGLAVRKFWQTPLTGYLYILLWFSALISYVCLLIERYRSRRASDSHGFNVILLLLISIAWVIYILLNFR